MVKEIEPSINERTFVLEALRQKIRTDNRRTDAFRKVRLTLGPNLGHVEVQLGKTRVAAYVSCEIVRPSAGNSTEGILQFNTEFSPMASPAFESGRLSEEEVLISRLLEKALRRSRAFDTEGLCIVAGEKVWAIRVDIRVLDHDGNLIDCACIAAVTALLHFRRPDVTVIGEEVTVHTMAERNPIAMSVHHIPICITFGFFDGVGDPVVDPTFLEEQVMDGDMTYVVNIHRELCTLRKAGGLPIDIQQVIYCGQIAAVKAEEITNLIKKALEEDAEAAKKKMNQ